MTQSPDSFFGLGIAPGLLDVLDALKFTKPTPIQGKAIPIAIEGKDIIGIAQTGTGKTLAFGIPMVQRLAAQHGKARGLIVVPTRELAYQVNDTLLKLAPAFKMRTAVLIGGESMYGQVQRLRQSPAILIATPGRLLDHIDQNTVRLDAVNVVVLDEADRMLDMGFLPDIERILKRVPRQRQMMLFSATMPPEILKIAQSHMHLPVRTEIAPSGTTASKVSQELFVVSREMKSKILAELLKQYTGSVLLFVRTRRAAAKVSKLLRTGNHRVAEIHADRSLNQRKDAIRGFKSGEYRVLVATDIAARGIDVTGIELVINYDLPDDPENYVHRIGRTGRAGREGHAISLATPDQAYDVRRIEKIIRSTIPLAHHPEVPSEKFDHGQAPQGPRPFGGQGKRRPFRPRRRGPGH
jgi:ATP-dependent RNA helicase RhlE